MLRPMTHPPEDNPYRQLPEPVRAEDLVETVDVAARPTPDEDGEERARMLRNAGA
jgi:hypothetical protein